MRVALLTNMLPPYRVAFYNEFARLVDLTVVVTALSNPDRSWVLEPGEFRFALVVEGGATARVLRKGASDHREARFVHLANRTLRTLMCLRPEVIVSGELGLRTAQAVLYARWTKTPIVCYWEGTGHTEARTSVTRRLWRRLLLRGVDAAWVNGIESADYLARLGVAPAAITSSMTGVDTDYFWQESQRARPQLPALRERLGLRGLVFGYSGALTTRKGIAQYLAACDQLLRHRPGAEFSLLFIGDGPERPLVERWGRDHPSTPVSITGFVQLPELPALYGCADWIVLPTLEDCWALTANEALVCGRPQLLSRFAGASADLSRLDGAGIVVDPLSADSLRAALERAIEEGPRRVPEATVLRAKLHYGSAGQAGRALASLQALSGPGRGLRHDGPAHERVDAAAMDH